MTRKLINLSEKNGMWRGDRAGLDAIHIWVRRRLVRPDLCQRCKSVPPADLANISGLYKRDLDDWEWLCRGCHMRSDGRMDNIHKITDMSDYICVICGERETNIQKRNGRPRWYNITRGKICHKCYMRRHDRLRDYGYDWCKAHGYV